MASAPESPRHEVRRPHERELAALLTAQDPAAAELIQAEYGRVLRGFLAQMLGDEHGAEDVLQQVLIQAWQRGASYDPARGSISSWLFSIARSRAIDAKRKRVPEPFDPGQTAALADRAGASADLIQEAESRWQLAYLLGLLPPHLGELLQMRFQLGLSQSEIAQRTGLPLGTVKTRMVAALQRLRELMEQA